MLETLPKSAQFAPCLLPQKDGSMKRGKKNEAYLTEYLYPAVIGHNKYSASDPKHVVTESELKLSTPLVISEQPVASRLVPRLRMLQKVVECLPKIVVIAENYNTKYHIETLACGHRVTVYWPNFGAKRRNCIACVKLAKKENQTEHRCPHCGLWACKCFERRKA